MLGSGLPKNGYFLHFIDMIEPNECVLLQYELGYGPCACTGKEKGVMRASHLCTGAFGSPHTMKMCGVEMHFIQFRPITMRALLARRRRLLPRRKGLLTL